MLLIGIDELDPTPVYRQIVDGIREHLALGELKPGDSLPSVRELAKYLGVNVNTVNKSYQILRDLGLIVTRPAIGTVVAPNIAERMGSESNEAILKEGIIRLLQEGRRLGFDPEEIQKFLREMVKEYKK